MKSISILVVLALTGCGHQQIIKEPYEVKVLVPVPCIDKAIDKPQWLMDNPELAQKSLFEKGNTALQELEQRRQYEREIEAVMLACIKKPE